MKFKNAIDETRIKKVSDDEFIGEIEKDSNLDSKTKENIKKAVIGTAKAKRKDSEAEFLSAIEKDINLDKKTKEYIKKIAKETAQYKIGLPYDPAKFDNFEKKNKSIWKNK